MDLLQSKTLAEEFRDYCACVAILLLCCRRLLERRHTISLIPQRNDTLCRSLVHDLLVWKPLFPCYHFYSQWAWSVLVIPLLNRWWGRWDREAASNDEPGRRGLTLGGTMTSTLRYRQEWKHPHCRSMTFGDSGSTRNPRLRYQVFLECNFDRLWEVVCSRNLQSWDHTRMIVSRWS